MWGSWGGVDDLAKIVLLVDIVPAMRIIVLFSRDHCEKCGDGIYYLPGNKSSEVNRRGPIHFTSLSLSVDVPRWWRVVDS